MTRVRLVGAKASWRRPLTTYAALAALSDILAAWHLTPCYLDVGGYPRALSRHGRSPSWNALVRSVDPTLDTAEVLRQLVRHGAVKRVGSRYVPTRRGLQHRHISSSSAARRARIERYLATARFPASRLDELNAFLQREEAGFLRRVAAFLYASRLQEESSGSTLQIVLALRRIQRAGASRFRTGSNHSSRMKR